MLIEESFVVEASRPDVAHFLLDVPRMGACVPGVEDLRRIDDDRYEAVLVIRLGPIQARFEGDVVIDSAEAPATVRARASGRDKATGSVAQVSFAADLVDSLTGETEIHTVSDVAIRGRLGQFGSGVISATAREMIKAFAQCALRSIDVGSGVEPSQGDPADAEPTQLPGLVSVIWRGLEAWLRGWWDRLFSGGRGSGGDVS